MGGKESKERKKEAERASREKIETPDPNNDADGNSPADGGAVEGENPKGAEEATQLNTQEGETNEGFASEEKPVGESDNVAAPEKDEPGKEDAADGEQESDQPNSKDLTDQSEGGEGSDPPISKDLTDQSEGGEDAPKEETSGTPAVPEATREAGEVGGQGGSILSPVLMLLVALLGFQLLQKEASDEHLSLPGSVQSYLSLGSPIKVSIPDVDSLSLFVRSEGPRDADVILLLPGFGATCYSFRGVQASLAGSGFLAVCLDWPGEGLSAKPLQGSAVRVYSPKEKARLLSSALDVLGHTSVHVVAHDTSGVPAVFWAAEDTARVTSLTLIDTALEPPFASALPAWLIGSPLAASTLLAPVLFHPSIYSLLLRACCSTSFPEDSESYAYLLRYNRGLQAARLALGEASSALNEGTAQQIQSHAEKELGRVPRQILWASTWQDQGEETAAQWPLSELRLHPCGRWPQLDCAEYVASSIADFVTTHAASGG